MGRHAAPRTPSPAARYARRAAVVSAGTLALCIGAAAPVLADTSPVPVPQPVSDAVQQVSQTTGAPNPIASTPPKHPHRHPVTRPTGSSTPASSAALPAAPATTSSSAAQTQVTPATLVRHTPRHTVQLAAASSVPDTTPARVPTSTALGPLPANPLDNNTVRTLAVAAAMMLLGGLTAGHLRNTQRLLTVPYAE